MTRPELTEEFMNECEAIFEKDPFKDMIIAVAGRELALELAYAGVWMIRQLAELGLAEVTIGKISFAHGQRVSAGGDVWETARTCVAEAAEGKATPPGEHLGDALIYGEELPYVELDKL